MTVPRPRLISDAQMRRAVRLAREIAGIDPSRGGVEFGPDGTVRFLPPAGGVAAVNPWDEDLTR